MLESHPSRSYTVSGAPIYAVIFWTRRILLMLKILENLFYEHPIKQKTDKNPMCPSEKNWLRIIGHVKWLKRSPWCSLLFKTLMTNCNIISWMLVQYWWMSILFMLLMCCVLERAYHSHRFHTDAVFLRYLFFSIRHLHSPSGNKMSHAYWIWFSCIRSSALTRHVCNSKLWVKY